MMSSRTAGVLMRNGIVEPLTKSIGPASQRSSVRSSYTTAAFLSASE